MSRPPPASPNKYPTASRVPMSTTDANQIKFMKTHHPGLKGDQTKWSGTKFLGYGGSAHVGLWE